MERYFYSDFNGNGCNLQRYHDRVECDFRLYFGHFELDMVGYFFCMEYDFIDCFKRSECNFQHRIFYLEQH